MRWLEPRSSTFRLSFALILQTELLLSLTLASRIERASAFTLAEPEPSTLILLPFPLKVVAEELRACTSTLLYSPSMVFTLEPEAETIIVLVFTTMVAEELFSAEYSTSLAYMSKRAFALLRSLIFTALASMTRLRARTLFENSMLRSSALMFSEAEMTALSPAMILLRTGQKTFTRRTGGILFFALSSFLSSLE